MLTQNYGQNSWLSLQNIKGSLHRIMYMRYQVYMNESTGEGLTLYSVQSSASAYLFWSNQPWFIHGIVEFGQKPHMISKHNEHILVVQAQLKG